MRLELLIEPMHPQGEYKRTEYVSTFGFPIRVPPTPERLFDEIRGFRVVKVEKDKTVYDLTAEQDDDRAVKNTVKFVYVGRPSIELPGLIVDAANQISVKFIAKTENQAQ